MLFGHVFDLYMAADCAKIELEKMIAVDPDEEIEELIWLITRAVDAIKDEIDDAVHNHNYMELE